MMLSEYHVISQYTPCGPPVNWQDSTAPPLFRMRTELSWSKLLEFFLCHKTFSYVYTEIAFGNVTFFRFLVFKILIRV